MYIIRIFDNWTTFSIQNCVFIQRKKSRIIIGPKRYIVCLAQNLKYKIEKYTFKDKIYT